MASVRDENRTQPAGVHTICQAMSDPAAQNRDPGYNLEVADPPPNGMCYIPGHKRAAYWMYIGWISWVSFYVGISVFVAYRLPCWLHGIKC